MVETNGEKEKGMNPMVRAAAAGAGAVIVVVIIVVIAVVAIVVSQKNAYKEILHGSVAPDFALLDMNDNIVKLSDYKGYVVFLNFWATWCEPCKDEMPSMQILSDSLKGKKFVILAVSSDTGGKNVVAKFLSDNKITFTVLLDSKGKIKEMYKTTGFPETFIIDQNGIVAEKIVGPRNWTDRNNLATVIELINKGPRTYPAAAK